MKPIINEAFFSRPTEFQLWSYALDLLERDEQDQIMEMIARDPEAQEELKHIRESIASAGEVATAESQLARIRSQAQALLEAMGWQLSSIAAILVPAKEGLIVAFENAAYAIGGQSQAVMAGPERAKSESGLGVQHPEVPSPKIEIRSMDGLKVSVICIPDRGVDLHIDVSGSLLDGEVGLFRCVSGDQGPKEEDTYIHASLKGGRARMEDCPSGLLKLMFSDRRELCFYVSPELLQPES